MGGFSGSINCTHRVVGGKDVILGEELTLAGLSTGFIKDRDGLLPGGALGIVDLPR